MRAALARADAWSSRPGPGGVEPTRVVATLEMTPANIPGRCGRSAPPGSGTNDLEATIEWWAEFKVPVWGVIPERVSIASGPATRLSAKG